MKKLIISFATLTLLLGPADIALKHPGRTDSSGCHVCRTNCVSWGLKTGEYHCHNGGSSSTTQTYQEPVYTAPVVDYANVGLNDGYNFKKQNPNSELGEASYTYADSTYQESFKQGYQNAYNELSTASSNLGTERGTADANLYDTYQSVAQENIINSVYDRYYKDAFDARHNEMVTEAEDAAKELAYQKVFNDEELEKASYSLNSINEAFDSAYQEYLKKYENAETNILKKAKQLGADDGSNKNDKDYSFMEKYEYTMLYTKAKKAYNKAYDIAYKENTQSTSVFDYVITAIVLGGIAYLVFNVYKKRALNKAN